MNATAPAVAPQSNLRLILLLALLAAAMFWFLRGNVHYFSDYSPGSYSDYYWPRRAGLIPHILGGSLAISAGLVQLWLGLTHRTGTLHQLLGRVYASGVLLGSLGAFYMALTIPGHFVYSTGLFMLAVAWVLTTGMAVYAIHNHRPEQHREWMLRSYTVTFAFVTFRLAGRWLHRFVPVTPDDVADQVDELMAWACWAVPLLLAEPLIQLDAMRGRRAPAR